eukprot:15343522-Ditylum_brightwellii.AAC.1
MGITSELEHWHEKRKSFNIRQVGPLTGQHSVAVCLAGNAITLKATSKGFQKLEACIKANRINSDDDLNAYFTQIHAAKMIWAYKKRYFINPSF